ncbi:disintegrin domain-containing protein [Caerostris extrusa]|uniref:Disintegrin domain-containing protein n=1 Tax=Caerostris extrusa TaxID=172846 RepID=A0AAV4Y3H8_CAEEX|nr:disintegrin domain-containing protein [Caerostris extrusa]
MESSTREECDCGTKCKYSCCTPPGEKKNECLYDRSYGHECEWYEPCCTQTCKIIPKSWRMYCGEGDPGCQSEDNYCDGKSSTCNGLKKDLRSSTGRGVVLKHGSHNQLCQPAEYFGLKSNVSNYFLRYAGFSCSTSQNEHCDRFGVCSSKLSSGSQFRNVFPLPPAYKNGTVLTAIVTAEKKTKENIRVLEGWDSHL